MIFLAAYNYLSLRFYTSIENKLVIQLLSMFYNNFEKKCQSVLLFKYLRRLLITK